MDAINKILPQESRKKFLEIHFKIPLVRKFCIEAKLTQISSNSFKYLCIELSTVDIKIGKYSENT